MTRFRFDEPAHPCSRVGLRDAAVATLVAAALLLWLVVETLARRVERGEINFTPDVAAIFDGLSIACIALTIACAIFMADLIATRFLK